MRFKFNLQWKVLLLVTSTMIAIVLASSHLHNLVMSNLIKSDRYYSAVRQTVSLANSISTQDVLVNLTKENLQDLHHEVSLVVSSRPDFDQIDVYQQKEDGLELVTTSAPQAQRLPIINDSSAEKDRNKIERPLPGVASIETFSNKHPRWMITSKIQSSNGHGYLTALVLQDAPNNLTNRLQLRHNLVLGGAVIASVGLLYLMFMYFFRNPARDIVNAMSDARRGNLNARVLVRRDDELGEIASGFNQLIEDISERNQERERLLTQISGFNEELRNKVEFATQELSTANNALFQTQQRLTRSERLAVIGQMAASLAHEVGTPLNAISGHLQLLARNHPQNADTQRRIQIINKQLEFIVSIVRSLLEWTHKKRSVLQPLNLNELVRELIWLVTPALDRHSITVSVSLNQSLPSVNADRDSLQQVLLNLINNSIDAMPNGGHIEISTQLNPQKDKVELIFSDSGLGIDPSAYEQIFEPMWTTKTTGSGFGLAIAREIMLEHDGEIEVLEVEGQGAVFRLTLPLSAKMSNKMEEKVMSDVS
jgi:two-component system, NtrC family, sensor kinase